MGQPDDNSPASSMDETGIDQDSDRDADPATDQAPNEHARPRKRTRRACDKCSTSRTRCDGECPCRRCKDYGYTCRYNRQVKKRGRLPASMTANGQQRQQQQSQQEQHQPKNWSDPTTQQESPREDLPSLHSLVPASSNLLSTRGLYPMKLAEDGVILNQNMAHDEQPRSAHIPPPPVHRDSMSVSMPGRPHLGPQIEPTAVDTPGFRSFDDSFGRISSMGDSAVLMSDESIGQPSPGNFAIPGQMNVDGQYDREPPGAQAASGRYRGSFSTSAGATDPSLLDAHRNSQFMHPQTTECRYKFLEPVLPFIRKIMPAPVACDLLDVYLTDPGSSLFRCASPYILTRIFRKKSILHPTNPRKTSPALLTVMLWAAAQTADIMALNVPSSRAKVLNELYDLAMALISEKDPDRWRRTQWGLAEERHMHLPTPPAVPEVTMTSEPAGILDDVLAYILLLITVSGGDFKSDATKWWSKAQRLALSLKLHREDEPCAELGMSACSNPLCACRRHEDQSSYQAVQEAREERRRVFWLLFSLDRHMALSFNTVISIPDSYCEVFTPLPEAVWENLDLIPEHELPARVLGPPVLVTGTSFFEFFLPLMAILGDIVEVHHRKQHPRLGLDDTPAVMAITKLLEDCERSVDRLADGNRPPPLHFAAENAQTRAAELSREQLVRSYSTHILHVLHVLLHGQWDAISMLDDSSDWITSQRFSNCATHAIAASQAVSTILQLDPELTFMPYLFGIYLLQGSFILLLFADRMPQVGQNESVEAACETIIRAHEVCVVTLNTDFQKYFRKVLRSTLYSVRGSGMAEREEQKARRRALSLYRWTRGGRGLGL
ncbi:hypothetical protein NLU13_7572 [Sarocladium strictum]|uniref:Zn(2)-C6 fungal-type domain-containing protein n=1 Tax=Sarocladium strictum TaxID=5046 RepID=A0AA39GDR7_SARSR|nr:hypothetical protein NLU13_7572 [Sarocladium strictum]